MSSYAIILQDAYKGSIKYKVALKTDDGYQEIQEYVGDETTLAAAANHMESEMDARKAKDEVVTEPTNAELVFIEV